MTSDDSPFVGPIRLQRPNLPFAPATARQGETYYEYKCCRGGGGEELCGDYDPGATAAGGVVIGILNMFFWIAVCVGIPICCWRRRQARMRAQAQMAQNQGTAMAVAQPVAQPTMAVAQAMPGSGLPMAVAQAVPVAGQPPMAVAQAMPVAGQQPMAVAQGQVLMGQPVMAPGTTYPAAYPTAAGYPQAAAAGPAMPMPVAGR